MNVGWTNGGATVQRGETRYECKRGTMQIGQGIDVSGRARGGCCYGACLARLRNQFDSGQEGFGRKCIKFVGEIKKGSVFSGCCSVGGSAI